MDNKILTLKPETIVSVVGGAGFLGGYVVRELAKTGCIIKVISRNASQSGKKLKICGSVGQISLIDCNVLNEKALENALKGSDVVINLVGVLYSRKAQSFYNIHQKAAENIARVCSGQGVRKLIHISALGVDRASQTSEYAKSKFAGEKVIAKHFSQSVVIRPSVIFGPEDNFINLFALMLKLLPIFPLIGGGKVKFQPVYVQDVANAVVKVAQVPLSKVAIRTLELGGPDQLSLREIVQLLLKLLKRKRILFAIPFSIAKVMAFFIELFPKPVITRDQVELLKYDNHIIGANGLLMLGVEPTSMEPTIKSYAR